MEKRQEAIIRDMDNAISAYLMEIRDENNRLIQELTEKSSHPTTKQQSRVIQVENDVAALPKTTEPINSNVQSFDELSARSAKLASKIAAASAYKKQTVANVPEQKVEKKALNPFEQQVIDLHKEGFSIDEIAKKTQKGKTEIELLLKFHA